ncbi:MAG: hypothetical protein HYW24_01470 [Candidatus Aenigmarchaeota archaeon]|nr:hypothetical protein [Candidatus Aenigmarchaeota archaeon]
MPIISREYEKFLREEKSARKLSFYEKICGISEKIFPIIPSFKSLDEKYQEAITFSHSKITPKGAYALAFVATWLFFIVSMLALVAIKSFSISSIFFSVIMAIIVFYFLVDYPLYYARRFRISASSEMVLTTIYMSISMHLSPNLENAIRFASKNLKGAMAIDLRELLWSVYTRRLDRTEDALDEFIKKWERESKEFATSLYLIKTSSVESQDRRERFLDEAVSVMLDGTKERMKIYARELKQPVTILNALGILLPIIGLVFFPIISVFLPELIKPVFLVFGYNIFLPLVVYLMMTSYLGKRPYSFREPDLSKHPEILSDRFYEKPYIYLLLPLPFIAFLSYKLLTGSGIFSLELLIYSMLLVFVGFGAIVGFSYLSIMRKLKIRQEISEIENEFTEALFQLGSLMLRGIPLETSLKRLKGEIKGLKISEFFEKILYNIKVFGMPFESAVFDKKYGAINYYPSTLIEAVMKVVVETSKRGMASASKSMVVVSKYLKDMHEVDEDLRNMMEDVTSTMATQAVLLAPLSAGIVVTIASVMTRLLIKLGSVFGSFGDVGGGLGPVGGTGVLSSIFQIGLIIPVHDFQLIVGIYLIEIVVLIAMALSTITNGDEGMLKKLTVARILGFSCIVYFITLIFTYYLFTSVISVETLIT